jgi:transaldolase/transaldolase/glucose-6-phosphate isomerase
MTSNPSIFEKAIVDSHEYDEDIRTMALEGKEVTAIYDTLSQRDVQRAADEFRSVYDKTAGNDGYVSGGQPHLAHDTAARLRKHTDCGRRWPAQRLDQGQTTSEGLLAIQELIGEGINVNVTLLFGLPRYRHVADAYLTGSPHRRRVEPVNHVASVASFFVSRIDGLVDPLLESHRARRQSGRPRENGARARGDCQRENGLSNLQRDFLGGRFKELAALGLVSTPLGQHQHQESGRERCEIRGGTHRTGHDYYGDSRNPRRVP